MEVKRKVGVVEEEMEVAEMVMELRVAAMQVAEERAGGARAEVVQVVAEMGAGVRVAAA